jgi:hypothetical protein
VRVYDRKTKVFFGAMAVIMGIGFPLSLLAGFPAFQSLLGGQQAGEKVTLDSIDKARVLLVKYDCDRVPSKIKGDDRVKCVRGFEDVGSGYLALTTPDPETGLPPRGQDENFDKAQTALKRAWALDPDNTEVAQSLASVYLQQQKYPQATDIFAKLAKSEPSNVDFQFYLASSAQQAQQTDTAIAAFEKFIKLAPEDSRVAQAKESIKTLKNPEAAGAQNIDLNSLG